MKKFLAVILAVTLLCIGSITAFAQTSSTVNINASLKSLEEMNAEIAAAANEGKTIIITWENGAIATLSPISDSQIEPYLNTTQTVDLDTSNFTAVVTDFPLLNGILTITNLSGNPGSIDIEVVEDVVWDDDIGTYYSLPVNYYTTFRIRGTFGYTVYVRACEVDGEYRIKARD